MRLSKFFSLGIINKNSDERNVPNGMFRHAENIRVTNSDGSNSGLVENIKGTKLLVEIKNFLTTQPFTEARTIGAGTDTYSGCIYYLVWTNGDDYLVEYNTITNQYKRVLQHSSVLNLSKDFLVSEIHVIRDSYSGKVFLTWTDNNNPPRFINLERAKTYAVNSFTEDDISLIKKPPRYEPKTMMLSSPTTKENNIEDKFLAFATRFKYLDGEYSALSSFSNYAFSPKQFNLDFATKENVGMVNQFNAVQVSFDTGSKIVTDIDLVYKESGSNSIYKIQTFNKENEGWGNDSEQSFTFINDKVYSMLPEKELYRSFDSVPLKAKDLSVIDNRLVFGGITEGRDMIDVNGQPVKAKYTLSLVGGEIVNQDIPATPISIVNIHFLYVDFEGIELIEGHKILFHVVVQEPTLQGFYEGDFEFILPSDFQNVEELSTNQSFIDFVETVWTNNFLDGYQIELPDYSEITETAGFQMAGVNGTKLMITPPIIRYKTDNTPNNPNDNNFTNSLVKFRFSKSTSVRISNYAVSSSLKSNRSNEVGIVYLFEHNQQTPVFVDGQNTIFISIDRSTYKNQIQVNLKNKPPVGADRYKFVLKTNKHGHETIYISNFYFDGAYVWCLLDGANKNKVKDGDTLIVKSDADGVKDVLIKTKILEIKEQPKGFLNNNVDSEDDIVNGEAGLYMKIRPNGFSFGEVNGNQGVFNGFKRNHHNNPIETSPVFGFEDNVFTPYELTEGSRVRIYFRFTRHGSHGFNIIFDKTYTVGSNYGTYKDWFEMEAIQDFIDFVPLYSEQLPDQAYEFDPGHAFPNWDYNVGYGFTEDGKRFWIRQKGCGSRDHQLDTEIKWEVYTSEISNIIFETEPKELDVDIYFETGQTFDIVDGQHKGNIQDQTDSQDAIILLDTFNCFVMGNGAESYKIKDDFNGNSLNIDLRPTTTTNDEYKQRNLFSAFTWGGNYEEFTQYNSLNEFNRSTLNIKQLDDKYGGIQRLIAMENSLVCFQEDKISQLLYRRKALFNQDGSSNVGATDVDFGDQIPFTGNYGVSQNPESIAIDKRRIYFTDRKRGVVCRLSLDGIEEIPGYYYESGNIRRETMSTWFRELFRSDSKMKCFGVFDPEYDEYVLNFQMSGLKSIQELKTIAFCQDAGSSGGWTSFFSYVPDMMVSLNGKLYGFEKGNLHRFNDDPLNRNTYFGKTYPSKIVGIFNEIPNDVKVFNAMNIEGNKAWDVKFHTNLTKGHLKSSEFRNIESEWYANFRRDETITTSSLATQGIGISDLVEQGRIRFTMPINTSVSVGDALHMNDLNTVIGKITGINGLEITYNNSVNTPVVGGFFFAQKSARIEGGAIRGYYLEAEFTVEGKDRVELFSVNTEISKSFP